MDETVLAVPSAATMQSRLPPARRYILRVKPAARAGIEAALGLALPVEARTCVADANWRVLWLGPDEFLLIGTGDAGIAVPPPTLPHSLVDVSDRQVAIALAGPRAADVLNAGCPLDLEPSAFPRGMCTRTVFGKAEIVLWREADDRFRIEVWRSFADYVSGLLDLVIAEYACDPAG
jgi:sarcosine oxidase subunit gamma